jgi:hypothetical protein
MAIKITLKNSVVQDSVPTTTHLAAVGELALNANINSLGIYMRASDNSIVKMAGPGSVTTPAASTTAAGIAELATSAETTTGTDTARVTTPAGVKAVTDAERTTSNNTYLALAGGTLTGVVAATAGSNSAPAIHFGDSDSGVFGGTNTVSLTAGGTTRLTADTGVSVVGTLAVTGAITSTSDLTIADKIIHAGDTNTAIRFPAADTVSVETGGSERARVDSSGRLLVASSSSRTIWGSNPKFQLESTDYNSSFSLIRNEANNAGPWIALGKSRGASNGSSTIVQDGDSLGTINWFGADGVDLNNTSAEIGAEIDGTPGSDDVPGKLLFKTTADGATSPTTRLTISSTGVVNVPDNGKFTAGASDDLQIYHDGSNSYILDNGTGHLNIKTNGTDISFTKTPHEQLAKFITDGACELYYDNSKKLDTNSGGVKVYGNIDIDDNNKLRVGTSSDLEIYHDGSNSFIDEVGTGVLKISGSAGVYINKFAHQETCAAFLHDGAVELYFDNGKKFETTAVGVKVLGAEASDANLEMYADEGDDAADKWNIYAAAAGHFGINNFASGAWEQNIECNPNGNVELYYDNSKKLETTSYGFASSGYSSIGDGTWAYLTNDSNKSAWGNDQDLQIWHDGSHGYLDNNTGWMHLLSDNFAIKDTGGGDAMIYCNHDGSVDLYWDGSKRIETTQYGAKISSNLSAGYLEVSTSLANGSGHLEIIGGDGGPAVFSMTSDGGDNDTDKFRMQVDDGGPFYLKNKYSGSWENNIMCAGNGRVELYYDGVKQCETNSGGMNWADGKRAYFGNSSDLQIYHDGSSSYIANTTGPLIITQHNNDIHLRPKTAEEGIIINNDGAVELYHDGSKRFETNSGGVEVTGGTLNMDSAAIQFAGNLSLPNVGACIFRPAADTVAFGINNGQRVSVNQYGLLFGTDTAAANALADYERGTWTPADGSSGSLTFTVGSASYVKVGDLVFINFYIVYPTTSDSATAYITGLPFTPKAGQNYSYLGGRISNLTNNVAVQVNAGSASLHVYVGDSAYTNSQLSAKYILVSGCYSTA